MTTTSHVETCPQCGGEMCPQCGGEMQRTVIDGRDAWACPADAYAYDVDWAEE